jgi:hypothetical protein
MTVQVDGAFIRLHGKCTVEDAEALLPLVRTPGLRQIDISGAAHLHAAVVQVLLAFKPVILGQPSDAFLSRFVTPALTAGRLAPGAALTLREDA